MISDRADGTGHAPHHAASSMLHITRICAALVLENCFMRGSQPRKAEPPPYRPFPLRLE